MTTATSPVTRAIDELRARPIDVTAKGFAALASQGEITAASLAARRPPLHEAGLNYPLLTLRESSLRHNIEGMAAYCAEVGVELAPHGKVAMAPQFAAAQLAAGAWGITVATIGQLRTFRAFGFPRLLLANELVDSAGIAWLVDELAADPGFEPYCYVDSLSGVRLLDDVLRAHPTGRPLPVLVELGYDGGRTGCRRAGDAVEVARAAADTSTLRVAGVAGYEGGLGRQGDQVTLDAVARYCRGLRELGATLYELGLCPHDLIVSAGGSAFFDAVVRELTSGWSREVTPTVLLRSGAYVTHDHGHYARVSPASRGTASALSLRPAIEVWSAVLSRPEPGLALLNAGRRDVPFDHEFPIPLRVRHRGGETSPADGQRVFGLDDQHAYLELPTTSRLEPGDLVCLGISHPCTAFDKWQVIPVVDDDERVTDVVRTFF